MSNSGDDITPKEFEALFGSAQKAGYGKTKNAGKRIEHERAAQQTRKQRARGDAPRSAAINIRVTEAFKRSLDDAAKQRGMSATEIIEAAVKAYLSEK